MRLVYLFFCVLLSTLSRQFTSALGSPWPRIFASNENITLPNDWITGSVRIQRTPSPANCCLTRLGPSNFLSQHTMLRKLCALVAGCILENHANSVNKDTNPERPSNKKESVIANCSANFPEPTMDGETARINPTDNSKKRSVELLFRSITSGSVQSPSRAQTPNSGAAAPDREIRFENITKTSARISGLPFLDVPKGDELHIHDLELRQEYLLFEAFSTLMGYLQPNEFPTAAMQDAFQNRVPFHLIVFQLLKSEIAAIVWILLWTTLALSVPFFLLPYLCCTRNNIQRLSEDSSQVSLDFRDKCTQRTLGFLLNFLLILITVPIILILVGNEQISKQMSTSITTSNAIFEDLNTFIKNTHMQISFVATSATDITIEAIRKDLEGVNALLGEPFQKELTAETGIDIALDTLDELKMTTAEVTSVTTKLLNECTSAQAAAASLQEQLKEISRQLTVARQQCRHKDQALCFTLQYTGLDVVFSCGNLTTDMKIKQLERIGLEKNFNSSIENARVTFSQVPDRTLQEAIPHVAEIKTLLAKKRTEVYKSAHSLDELTRSLLNSVGKTQDLTLKHMEAFADYDMWRWLSILGVSTMLSVLWGLLLCGAPCGCGITSRTIPLLLSGVSLISLMCLVLWALGTASFLVGSHGQALVCEPLYDHPRYETLAKLFNPGGVLYKDRGFFRAFLKGNATLKVEDVLKGCHRNQPAYSTFSLHNVFDIKSVTNYKAWPDFRAAVGNFTVGESGLEILSPSLQLNLQVLSTVSGLDLSVYRAKMSAAVTKKDLNSFAEQLNTVARQLADEDSSQRLDNLALMTRKIIHNEMARLNDLRDRLLYKITALDVLIHPVSKQANQSLAHLKTIQYFLDNQGWQIGERSAKKFTSRIEGYLEELHNHIATKIAKEVGKCRPLWEIFQSTRFCICKLIVDPMNGISVLSFTLILLFLLIVPVSLKLVEHYRDLSEELLTSITHRRARDGLTIDSEGTWATPSFDVETRNPAVEAASWARPSSRNNGSDLGANLPPIPSSSKPKLRSSIRLSTIASRISSARVPQIPSVSRARSPKRLRHDSLKLIDPVAWKSSG